MLSNKALRILYIIVGILMIIYALISHLIIPGIPFALLIIGGILLIIAGWPAGTPVVRK
jgi:hypothetical protein